MSPGGGRGALASRIGSRRSYWVITLAIVLPAWAVSQFDLMERVYKLIPYQRVWWLGEYLLFAAVFLPAAIRQSNWRKGLVLAVVAGGVYAWTTPCGTGRPRPILFAS